MTVYVFLLGMGMGGVIGSVLMAVAAVKREERDRWIR
jgi:gas vesicle protein